MVWFTSDLHFGHANVIKFCNRPYKDTKEMNEGLIENWNKRVRKRDHVYVLGDFASCGLNEQANILKRLNGYKILITGNHDRSAHKMLNAGFDEVRENCQIKLVDKQVYLSHFPYHPMTTYINAAGHVQTVLPPGVDTRFLHKRIVDDGSSWLIHGHVHQHWKINGRQINVGVDVWDMAPISHEKILQIIDKADKND